MDDEASPPWTRRVVNRKGKLFCGTEVVGEVSCLDVRGLNVYLAPLSTLKVPTAAGHEWSFQTADRAGLLQIVGTLVGVRPIELNRVSHRTLELAVDSSEVKQTNRRAHYRVVTTIKGEIAAFDREELPDGPENFTVERPLADVYLERLSKILAPRRRPCVIRDLSVNGARLAVASPPPPAGQAVLLDLSLGPGEILRNLCCHVIESRPGRATPPFDAEVRLRFFPTAPRVEAQLARYLAKIQREMIQRGVRL